MDRDFFMTTLQAKEFGVIDEILDKRTKDEIDLLESAED
jgi:ATP-dependent protease ClpP protease subunit